MKIGEDKNIEFKTVQTYYINIFMCHEQAQLGIIEFRSRSIWFGLNNAVCVWSGFDLDCVE